MLLTESIAIGLVIGFFFYEWVGLSAGGLVVPGYIALYWDRPLMIASTLVVSLITLGVVRLLARVTILYGRRRFILVVLVGFLFRWLFEIFVARTGLVGVEIDTIGYIIPGLIANEMERQRVLPTLFSLLTISVLVRLVLILLRSIKGF
jgi:gamma-polyglutamate biosynthesis protein CapC